MSEQENKLINQAYEAIEKHSQKVQNDPYRLTYHLMPPVGLLNDPNGFIQFQGTYHIFYQWNPFETRHGAKFWGHYSSIDLVRWKQEPIALAPSEWFEKNGCYSGSAVENQGKMVLFYTGNVKNEDGKRETYQCKAVSTDGIHFWKEGPVITLPEGYTPHFRDPKVWKKEDRWYMIVGAQTVEKEGVAVLFMSFDLNDWKCLGEITGSNRNGLGEFGYMWECPDLFHLDGKDILLVSPQGLEPQGDLYHNVYQSGYFIGVLDAEMIHYDHGPFTELDRGFDFYAPQTTVDEKGRRLMFGWMGITDEMEPYHPSVQSYWIHALTIPRQLSVKNNKVYQHPVPELQQLRQKEVSYTNVFVESNAVQLDEVKGNTVELMLDNMNRIADDTIHFQMSLGEVARMNYDFEQKRFTLERQSFKDATKVEQRHCQLKELRKLQLYLDTSSLEVFLNDGEEVFTARIFPGKPLLNDQSITFSAKGKISFDLKKWNLNGKME